VCRSKHVEPLKNFGIINSSKQLHLVGYFYMICTMSSWWWAVCPSKHVEPLKNFGIINSIKKLHLVGISTEWNKGLDKFHFRASDRHKETFTSSSLHNTDYSLLLHVSAIGYDHLQGATNFIYVRSVYRSYVTIKFVHPWRWPYLVAETCSSSE